MADIQFEPPHAAFTAATDFKIVDYPLQAATTLDRLAARALPPAPEAAPSDTQIRVKPYEYSGKNNGNARMYPDHVAGKIGIGGSSGHVDGGASGQVSGTAWLGTSIWFGDQGRRVRCCPVINWKAGWTLWAGGLPDGLFGADPWASVRMGVQIQAYDGNGAVSDLVQRELVNQDLRHSGIPAEIDDWNDGVSADMNVWFDVPAGQARWVNVLLYADMNAAYTPTFNVASVQAGMDIELRWLVVDPE